MIVLKIESWPGGNELRAKQLGQMHIENAEYGPDENAYRATYYGEDKIALPRFAVVNQFERGLGFWRLILACLQESFK